MRYIYSGATKTIQYVFISVGLAATVIRLAMMSYVLLRKFLLWRSGVKNQGLYSIFFSYFYPGKWSSGWSLGTGEFYHWKFQLNLQIYCALHLARKGEKKGCDHYENIYEKGTDIIIFIFYHSQDLEMKRIC